MEGRLYVISVSGVLSAGDIPDDFPLKQQMLAAGGWYPSGGTFIVAPDGDAIEGPIENEETIVYADLDVRRVLSERQNFDPAGHYHRPDVFTLRVNRDRQEPLAPS